MVLLPPPQPPTAQRFLASPGEEAARSVLVLNACLERMQRWDGPLYHELMAEWIRTGLASDEELWSWVQNMLCLLDHNIHHPGLQPLRRSSFDDARRQADRWLRLGVRPAAWSLVRPPPAPETSSACPKIVFYRGNLDSGWPWATVFNSRKPKAIPPDARWLRVLRTFLPWISSHGIGIAASTGTTTYDLVAAHARHSSCPLLLVLPHPVDDLTDNGGMVPHSAHHPLPSLHVACRTRAVKCTHENPLVCRDRLIAFLSDFHLILEVRAGGNLFSVLERQQMHEPRYQWVLVPEKRDSQTEGNFRLLDRFADWIHPLPSKDFERILTMSASGSADSNGSSPREASSGRVAPAAPWPRRPEEIPWREYLYHYTRSCPGPWPGQTREEYLLSLLHGECLCGHTALDTLARMLSERRIRASSKLLRGNRPVISWTSKPPSELSAIRRWNRALLRWTFEPYGVAVKRALLRKKGAKPVVYAPEPVYTQLKPSERFRYQRHEPPRCSWRIEREWRSPGDLLLDGISPEDGFVFVPSAEDGEYAGRHAKWPFPTIVLDSV